nr:DNA helicase [Tanacetum cinerariifolium]
MLWKCEKVESASHIRDFAYNKCCYEGRIILCPPLEYPQYIKELYNDTHFMDNIREYKQMFSMTSLGANVDNSMNNGKGPYVFRVSGTHKYEPPTAETVGAIVFAQACDTENNFDLIVEEHSRFPQRVNNLHPCYMSLQFPLLFIYGEDGYHKDMELANVLGQSTKGDKRMSMNIPTFFITFTCNAKWPEIEEFMEPFPQLTTADRADIVDRVFEKKVRDYVNFVRNSHIFGDVTAELPDPLIDADGYAVVSELMIYGPCGAVNMNASCMKDGSTCNRHFPKAYCDQTYIDKDGFVHY